MAKTVQVSKPNDAGAVYDAVRGMAKDAGKEKAFVAEFGERDDYLRKCGATNEC